MELELHGKVPVHTVCVGRGKYRATIYLKVSDGFVAGYGYGTTAALAVEDLKKKLKEVGWTILTKTSTTLPTPEEGPR